MDIILIGLAQIISTVLTIYMFVVIAAVLITWVNPDPYNPIVRILRQLTEPLFYRVRRLMPFLMQGGLDLSPIVVVLAVSFLRFVVPNLLYRLAVLVA